MIRIKKNAFFSKKSLRFVKKCVYMFTIMKNRPKSQYFLKPQIEDVASLGTQMNAGILWNVPIEWH